jgi:hypothetical protein
MARVTTAVTFIILMSFTTVAFGKSPSQQITLTISTFTISAIE